MKQLCKTTFSNIFFVYKNMFHWVFSKILIIISSVIIGFIFILPLVLLLVLYIYFFPNTNYLIIDLIRNFLTLFFILIAFLNFKFLIIKLSLKYTDGKKMKIKLKNYFNFKILFKFIKTSLLIFLGFLLITLIFLVLGTILVFIFGGLENINNIMAINGINSFSIILLILFIIYLFFIFYYGYRTYFSLYIITEDNKETAFKIIKKSFNKTRKNKKIFKLIGILLILFLILLPIEYIGQHISFNKKTLEYYINIKNKKIKKEKLNTKENIDYTFLDKKFGKYNNKELVEKYYKNSTIKTIYIILHFLLIFGIFDLVLANFYKREVK